MRTARELCGFSQIVAAKRLGYSNSSKLNKVELASDTNSIPFWLIPKASQVYEVSSDYLLGLADSWECLHAEALQSQIERAIQQSQSVQNNPIRQLYGHVSNIENAVSINLKQTVEFKDLVTRFRCLNPGFDNELKLGAKLLRMANETTQEANKIAKQLAEYHSSIKQIIN
ncbi:MAG: helix-turn-helix transcriptional regulator [Methylobacter sp.]|uniref:helix-turn-helix domain-containing protein n=1 Tax=Methylobacter sp. TaxID=2051955 RepID=UPI0027306514|nr:helix-turn-helix transcriptional regulator [Methylobacter sp.]MDP1664490.1 helix-turn-helix transcriptional regulator [Methylobacter sp.]